MTTGTRYKHDPRNPGPSTHEAAHSDLASHAFVPGCGFVKFPYHVVAKHGGGKHCNPPAHSLDGSKHVLTNQSQKVVFTWVADQKSWKTDSPYSPRAAFTSEYLAAHGWSYRSTAS